MIENTKHNFKYPVLVAVLFIVFMAHLLLWQSKNKNYFNYDSFRHYFKSVQIFEELSQRREHVFSGIKKIIDRHPPGVYLTTALFHFFLAPTQNNAVLINTALYVSILLFSLYKLGVVLWDRRTGLLSCAIVILYPAVFNQAKIYMLDLPLLSLVTLNIYLLIRSSYFQSLKYSGLFVFSLLAGLCIKLNFLFFVIGPLLYAFFVAMRRQRTKASLLLFVVIALIGFIVFYNISISPPSHILEPSYSYELKDSSAVSLGRQSQVRNILDRIVRDLHKLKSSDPIVTSTSPHLRNVPFIIHRIRALLWYIWGFINWQGSFIAFIVFVGGLCVFLKSKQTHKTIIITWLVSSYFILSWFLYAIDVDMEVTGVRYSMPLLACVGLLSAYGLLCIKRKGLKIACICVVLFLALIHAACSSYPFCKNHASLRINIAQDKFHIVPAYLNLFSTEPLVISGSSWTSMYSDQSKVHKEIEDIFFFINGFYEHKQIKTLLLADNAQWWHLQYLAYKHNKDLVFFCDYRGLISKTPLSSQGVHYYIDEADFAIEIKDAFTENYLLEFNEQLKDAFRKEKAFGLIKEDEFCRIFKREL